MQHLVVDPFLLVRAPAYSYENFNELYLREVLHHDFFKAAIFLASQSLYCELRKKGFNYDELEAGARLTLWKYLNRMCFRPLPYGFFSSFSAAAWTDDRNNGLCLSGEEELIIRPDCQVIKDYLQTLPLNDFHDLKYYTNNSIYQSSKQLRFISQAYSAQNKFAIVQVKLVPGLNKLLKFISQGRTKQEVINFLAVQYGDDLPLEEYFESLLTGQVVVSALAPNVTGPGFSQRCLRLLERYRDIDLNNFRTFRLKIKAPAQDWLALNRHIDLMAHHMTSSYSLYQRNIIGGLPSSVKGRLIGLIANMDKLCAARPVGTMGRFLDAFIQKYDQQEVPLMLVLDPGSGIGYENLAAAFNAQNDNFINDLYINDKEDNRANWGAVEKLIFKKWNNLNSSGTDKIVISTEDLAQLPASAHLLPPGLFVLFKHMDQELWIDAIGGVSGIELSARFGEEGNEVAAALKLICKHETELNNGFVFAEIAFSPNDRSANINQRAHYYDYEIPVLTNCTRPEEFTIRLSDLVISVRDQQVLLRSVKLNRFIIPRLSSAYNYKLSAIPVFRFLCDLQFQGLQSNLSCSLQDMFPGMDYYPRLQVEDAVVSPATWVLNKEQIGNIAAGDGSMEELNIPQYFSLLEGDNYLVFNRLSSIDRSVFRKCIKNKSTATLTEYTFALQPDLKDTDKQHFASQYVACILNRDKSYHLPSMPALAKKKDYLKVKRSFMPGQEWLYVKLYAHYSLTDEILLNFVLPITRKYKKENPAFKWFFIRYRDSAHHLRLRFYTGLKSPHNLLSDLVSKLESWAAEGKVTDVVLDTYQRELEKYSVSLISEAESFFYRDSEFILSIFTGKELDTSFKLSFAVNSSLHMIRCFIPDIIKRNNFLTEAQRTVSAEFSRDKEVLHKMDSKYRKFRQELIKNQQFLELRKGTLAWTNFEVTLQNLISKMEHWEESARYNLLINLVHMHINRIFENTPREYEFLIYHFMKKHQSYLNYTASGGS